MRLDPPAELVSLTLPAFGEPATQPHIPPETFALRLRDALTRAKSRGLDALVVYGDREHNGNMTFLTGYDPRFEEALFVLTPSQTPVLIVGNEGWSYTELAGAVFQRELYQTFSLMGQPRGNSRSLADILQAAGITPSTRVGLVGWKHYDALDGMDGRALEVPSYIVETLRGIAQSVVNAGPIFSDPADGLRVINDVDQLAVFEHAATFASQGVRNVIMGLRPGMTEFDAVRLMGLNGLPHGAHTMLSTGARAPYGLPSPSNKTILEGEPLTTACCFWGALTARAGFVVKDETGLPREAQDYVARLVAPYFSAAVAWYETVGIGVPGRVMHDAVMSRIGTPFFNVTLNPGHLIHIEEWLHSPITADSDIPLRSGMALQIDIIPATGTALFTTNIEDGIALADADLRQAFASRHPEAWARITARRTFMIDVLGIRLKPEVLPFSNMPGYLTPYLLSPDRAMAVRR